MSTHFDVAILGGGPAGSTAASLLARKGRSVVILERERFPRFHIGESLLPYSMSAFERLGLRKELDRRYITKPGGEVATACGTKKLKFYFKDGYKNEHPTAYQVMRSDFDKLLLDRATLEGADVREETAVQAVEFGADEATIRTKTAGGETEDLHARFVLDCSGRQTHLANALNLKQPYPGLNKLAIFAHYDGVQRDSGQDAGIIRLVRGAYHWFWLIPVSDTTTSIGLVLDTDDFRRRRQSPQEVLDQHLNAQPLMRERMRDARLASKVHTSGDYSYRNTRLTGDRWALVGDAAGFIDPIFSTGVFLAVYSAEKTADAVDTWLDDPARGRRALHRYERQMRSVMKLYLRFVNAWYREEFIEVFTNPVGKIRLAEAVNSVLAGNIGHDFSIWWRMQLFYLVVFLQRFIPLCPRVKQPAVGS